MGVIMSSLDTATYAAFYATFAQRVAAAKETAPRV